MTQKSNNPAKEAIRSYLDARAASDPLFAASYAKPDKNINECFGYILQEARKRGTSVCMTDVEVFGLAVHYYDEDDIKVSPARGNCLVITTREAAPEPELTEEEKAAARSAAIKRYEQKCMAEEAERAARRRKAEAERKKAAAERREQQEPSFFNLMGI